MVTPFSENLENDSFEIVNVPPQTQVNLDKSLTNLLFLADFGLSLPKPTEEPIKEIEDKWIPVKMYATNLKVANIQRPLLQYLKPVPAYRTSYKFTVEKFGVGYIINRLIFMDLCSYETIVPLNLHTGYCFVCQMYVEGNDMFCTNHVMDREHKKHFLGCILLPQHGLNMIRKIGEKVHCGICNIICFEDQLDLHLSSKDHDAEFASATSLAKVCIKEITKNMNTANNSPSTSSKNVKNMKKSPSSFENVQSKYQDVTREELSGKDAEPILPELTYLYMESEFGYLKISVESWHTIIDDYRCFKYCFLCDTKLWDFEVINEHIRDPSHISRLSRTGVLEVFGVHFIRKIREDFHCGVCNVIIYYLSVDEHVTWDTHVKAVQDNLIPSRRFKKMHQKKIKILTPPFEKYYVISEDIVRNFIIDLHVSIQRVDFVEKCLKPHKRLILLDVTLKIKWSHWNSITTLKNGFKCLMCQLVIKDVKDEKTVFEHTELTSHISSLTVFSRKYKDDLFRVINNNLYHCMMCNTEICRKGRIFEHLNGARHKENVELMEHDKFSEDVILDNEPVTITWSQCI